MLSNTATYRPALLMVFVAMLLGACSALSPQPRTLSPEQMAQLEERVRGRWQTIIDRDFEATYDYASPAYRASFPKQLFVKQFSYTVEWQLTGLEIVHYDAGAAVASVAVRVMSKPTKQTLVSAKFGALPSTFREQWLLVDGQWWYSANI
ncbi:hypothetical protein [Parahaliea aestuarii]|uniref:Nuclear transport factor 2 family protein n=1 Tax=Parahaliea aestuarii TaxID=1852021 RepID=A0A5C8ZP85_9GAMM|nr:hypothetical protein [Parahaliea aestuarii]TXS90065.1 hypothetical protein FVW59_15805 [Parahaliea aestuarii]